MSLRVENASETSILGSIVNRVQNVASALYNLARRVTVAVWNIFTCRCSNAVTPPIATPTPIPPSVTEESRTLPPSDQQRMVLEASQTGRDLVAGEAVLAQATAVLGVYQASLGQASEGSEAREISSDLGKTGTGRDAERLPTTSLPQNPLTDMITGQPQLEASMGSTPPSEISSGVSLGSTAGESKQLVSRGTTLGGPSTPTPLRPSRAHIPVKDMTTIGEAEGNQDSSGSPTSVISKTSSPRTLQNLHNGSSRAQRRKNNKGKGTQAPVSQKSSPQANRTAGDSTGSKSKLPTGVQMEGIGSAVLSSGLDPSQLRGTLKSRGGQGKTPIPVTNSFQALADEVEGFELDSKRRTLVLVPTSEAPVSGSTPLAGQNETSHSDEKGRVK